MLSYSVARLALATGLAVMLSVGFLTRPASAQVQAAIALVAE